MVLSHLAYQSAFITSSLVLLSALPANAQTVPQNSLCSIRNADYIELPDGRCFGLTHLPWLGVSQRSVEISNQALSSAMDFATQDNLTESERLSREAYADNLAQEAIAADSSNDTVSRKAFIAQTGILSQIADSFSGE